MGRKKRRHRREWHGNPKARRPKFKVVIVMGRRNSIVHPNLLHREAVKHVTSALAEGKCIRVFMFEKRRLRSSRAPEIRVA